jgi:glucan phosphorylase
VRGFDLQSFNAGDYEKAIESSNSAAAITSVLYPNDHTTCKFRVALCTGYVIVEVLTRLRHSW